MNPSPREQQIGRRAAMRDMVEDKEIDELRKRIDRLEWLITVMRDQQSVDALKGALIDAQRRLEELLKKRNGGMTSELLYLHLQAQRIAGLAIRSRDRWLAAKLAAISGEFLERAETLVPDKRRAG
jgi:cell division septum initiation protein DivIVA